MEASTEKPHVPASQAIAFVSLAPLHRLMISFLGLWERCPCCSSAREIGRIAMPPAGAKRPFLNPPVVKPGNWQGEILDG